MSITPRPYQSEAREAVYRHLERHSNNPCVEIPTAGGKSLIMAMIASDVVRLWQGRVLIAAHVKELLQQNAAEIVEADPSLLLHVGVYSAGLGEKDPHRPITVAGVQSAYKKPQAFGKIDLVIVDEAHLIPPEGEGMYRTLIAGLKAANPELRVVGFTATPYRTTTGRICAPENILNAICYRVGVLDLIRDGYISKLVGKSVSEPNTESYRITAGEFNAADMEKDYLAGTKVRLAVENLVALSKDRLSRLVFCTGVDHASAVLGEILKWEPESAALVTAKTDPEERARLVEAFKRRELRTLVNVNLFTTGFNARNVDCVAMLRATKSPGLMYQIFGRGFRLYPGKENCLCLDYGGNLLRHGPIDKIETPEQRLKRQKGVAPWKVCIACLAPVPTGAKVCPECGFEFPKGDVRHEEEAGKAAILSGQAVLEKFDVAEVFYSVHLKPKDGGGHSKTLRVDYKLGLANSVAEWVCIEHDGFARQKACLWWARRSKAPIPKTVAEALALCHAGAVAKAKEITTRTEGKYDRVVGYVLDPKPETWETPTPCAHERFHYKMGEVPVCEACGDLVEEIGERRGY